MFSKEHGDPPLYFTNSMKTISSIIEKKLAEIYSYFFSKLNKCYTERRNGPNRSKSKLCFLERIIILNNNSGYLKPFFLGRR